MSTDLARLGGDEIAKCDLVQLELIIEAGLETFVEVGEALVSIRERRLFTEAGYATFDEYCQKRWDFGKNYANRLIRAADVVESVPIGTKPANEAQARELAKAPVERRAAIMEHVTNVTGGKPTAEAIKDEVIRSATDEEYAEMANKVKQYERPARRTSEQIKADEVTAEVSHIVAALAVGAGLLVTNNMPHLDVLTSEHCDALARDLDVAVADVHRFRRMLVGGVALGETIEPLVELARSFRKQLEDINADEITVTREQMEGFAEEFFETIDIVRKIAERSGIDVPPDLVVAS